MSGRKSGWLARVVDVRPGERRALLLSGALFFAVLSSYYLIRGLRDELGVRQGVRNLPELWQWTAGASLAAHPLIGWAVARFPRRTFVPLVFRAALVCVLAAFYVLTRETGGGSAGGASPSWLLAARAFYVGVTVWAMLATSLFWSLMADVWNAEQGKRLFGFIATGGTIGAMAGSGLMTVAALYVDPLSMLLLCAALLELCARLGRRVVGEADAMAGAEPERRERIGGSPLAGLAQVARSPYLLAFAAFLLLLTFANAFLYYHVSTVLEAHVHDERVRTSIFSGMDLATNALTLVGQGWLAARLVRRYGAGLLLASLPLVSLLGFGALVFWPVVPVVVGFNALQRAGRYALVRPGRALLFTVLSRSERYKAQNFLDVVLYRAGDAGSAEVYDRLADPDEGLGLGVPATAAIALAACLLTAGLAFGLGRAFEARAAARET